MVTATMVRAVLDQGEFVLSLPIPDKLQTQASASILLGHQPTPMLFLELGALVCGSDLPGEGSSLLTRIGHEVWALPGSKHTSLV